MYQKTTARTPFGLFEFIKMPFGLRNAAQTFQRFMHDILRDFDSSYSYLDDILIASDTLEQHKAQVEAVLRKLNEVGLTLNPSKCEYAQPEIAFLGFKVNNKGILPSNERVEAILSFPQPTTIIQLRKFSHFWFELNLNRSFRLKSI